MGAPFKVGPNKGYPSIPTVSGDVANHTLVLEALREAVSIHERRTANTDDSFVRLGELEELGVINIDSTTKIVVVPDDDGLYIQRDGTSPATTGLIKFGDGIQLETGADQLKLDLDGTDANLTATGIVDLNITDITAINFEDGSALEWADTEFFKVADGYLPGETPDDDPQIDNVIFLLSGETATAPGVQSLLSDIGNMTVNWRNNASTPDTWGYVTDAPDPVKNGIYSLYMKGDTGLPQSGWGSSLTCDNYPDWYLGTQDFCLELHAYFVAFSSSNYLITDWDGVKTTKSFRFDCDSGGRLGFSYSTNYTNSLNPLDSLTPAIVTGQWYHIAVSREGDIFRMFVDGVLIGTSSSFTSGIVSPPPANHIGFGCNHRSNFPDGGQEMYIDNVRVTVGHARYTTSFTAPTKPYQGTAGAPTLIVGDPLTDATFDANNLTLECVDALLINSVDATIDASRDILLDSAGAFDVVAGADSSLGITGLLTINTTTGVDINDVLDVDDSVTVNGLTSSVALSTDDADAAITGTALTDLNVVGFTAINLDSATAVEWGDVQYMVVTAGAAAGDGDPYFDRVVFMSAFDGADAATATHDSSIYGAAVTFSGNAQLDTAQKKFGTASLLCD
ncbi:MAG: LamG-like jellyroll fold domain-containing protein, partial [Planctomycetota bacterium]